VDRILALPVDDRDGSTLVEKWTQRLRRPSGTWSLHAHQALALEYAAQGLGPFLPITVGGGKTLLGALLPTVMGVPASEAVVLCPPDLVAEAERELPKYHQQFEFEAPVYVPYSILSATDSGDLLDELAPRLIIADEAHCLKNPKSSRGRRFVRYMRAHPDTQFVAMSATFSSQTLKDFAHLAVCALGEGNPLPNAWMPLEAWSRVVDTNNPSPPSKQDFWQLMPLVEAWGPPEDGGTLQQRARIAFGHRFKSTPGVVVTEGDSCDAEIVVRNWRTELPPEITDAMTEVTETALTVNGTVVEDIPAKLAQMAHGFYYYPDWAAIGLDGPDLDWLYAKRLYESALSTTTGRGKRGLESKALVERRLRAGGEGLSRGLVRAWEMWQEQAHKPEPPQAEHWLSDEVLVRALEFADSLDNCLVWVSFDAVRERYKALGASVFDPGSRPEGGGTAVVSTYSHSTGLNLQHEWANNLVLHSPANGGRWQQLLGRTHRHGQPLDTVQLWVNASTAGQRRAFAKAKKSAAFLEQTQQLTQKLLHARYEDD
jgi:hypothetical protein